MRNLALDPRVGDREPDELPLDSPDVIRFELRHSNQLIRAGPAGWGLAGAIGFGD